MAECHDVVTKLCRYMPDDITDEELENLAQKARDYLLNHVLSATKPLSLKELTLPPFTLFPHPVPEECYNKAYQVQQSYNLLYHKVAHDYQFLESALSKVIKGDAFMRRVWNIYEAVHKEGVVQKVSLEINRSDYLMDLDSEGRQHIKQVEINTIGAGGATDAYLMSACHKYILQTCSMSESVDKVPGDKALNGVARSLEAAWLYYNNSEAVLLIIVEKKEEHINVYDQIMIDYFKYDINPNIKIMRKSYAEMHSLSLEGADRKLFIDGHEVAVVYYNCGCCPGDYKCEKDWTARLDMERSLAVKCTDIGGQLAGTKKVQQVLAEPGMLERFLSDPEEIKLIRDTFTAHYSLDKSSSGNLAMKKARTNPYKYVIKPQREGGGNNIFGDDIPRLLDRIENTEERNGYVMMDLIKKPGSRNVIVRSNSPIERVNVVCELGIYGALLGSAEQMSMNTCFGHYVKCKLEDADEGGVESGNGSPSSVLLI